MVAFCFGFGEVASAITASVGSTKSPCVVEGSGDELDGSGLAVRSPVRGGGGGRLCTAEALLSRAMTCGVCVAGSMEDVDCAESVEEAWPAWSRTRELEVGADV
jgi:hypothetical protein